MKCALILIDFINEFLHPDGKITPQGMGDFVRKYHTIENVGKLIEYFRKNQEEVIWVHLGFHENYDNCSTVSPRFKSAQSAWILQENTWSTTFLTELGHDPSEKTITKTRVSPFYRTDLDEYLRAQWIEEVFVAGVATDLAVSSIVRDLHDRDYHFTVVSDACATTSIEHHDAALIAIRKLGNVQTTTEVISY